MTTLPAQAECRGCGKGLVGKPYCMGGRAYHPETKEPVKINFYGGFVCSEQCDFQASLCLEQSMPGHGAGQTTLHGPALAAHKMNWRKT